MELGLEVLLAEGVVLLQEIRDCSQKKKSEDRYSKDVLAMAQHSSLHN